MRFRVDAVGSHSASSKGDPSMTRFALAPLIATLIVLVACYDSAAPEADTEALAADLSGLAEGWNVIEPGGDTTCSDGTDYKFFARPGDPEKPGLLPARRRRLLAGIQLRSRPSAELHNQSSRLRPGDSGRDAPRTKFSMSSYRSRANQRNRSTSC